MYPNISKCNAKSCTCCNHLICRSTIISSVNHRQFSVVNNSHLDWKSEDVIYVLTCSEGGWGMQYVGQTKWALKTRFKEHLLEIKKAMKIDTFLYQHFRSTGHSWSSSKVLVQPVEKTRGPRATGRSPEWHSHYRYADVMQHFSSPVFAANEKINL